MVRIEALTPWAKKVPADRYYGSSTGPARHLINFDIGEDTMPRGVVRLLAWKKHE